MGWSGRAPARPAREAPARGDFTSWVSIGVARSSLEVDGHAENDMSA
jgi:hypothetical protein